MEGCQHTEALIVHKFEKYLASSKMPIGELKEQLENSVEALDRVKYTRAGRSRENF